MLFGVVIGSDRPGQRPGIAGAIRTPRGRKKLRSSKRLHWVLGVVAWVSLAWGGCASDPEKQDPGIDARPAARGGSAAGAPLGVQPGEKVKEYDLNRDNKPDVWAYYASMEDPANPGQTRENLARKEWDFNFDGKVDIRRHFNFRGETVKDELDLDFDGRFDVTTFFQGGVKVRQEYDLNFDSRPDVWKFFEKNQLARVERDRDNNGRVDRWEYYADAKLDRVGLDEDGDGQVDR